MMFEFLTTKFEDLFYKIRNRGKLSPNDLDKSLREIKLALLEADVNFKVVKEFIEGVKKKAIGGKILESLTPSQQIIKIVNEEITAMLGNNSSEINFSGKSPTIILMVGIQGTGKTTAAIKLANFLKKNYQKKVAVVAADIYRPAAVLQLKDLAKSVNIEVYSEENKDPVLISYNGVEFFKKAGSDVIVIDTAGRLQIDKNMMREVENIRNKVKPHQILLVLDAMTGQEAVNIASEFNSRLECDGIILTKLDSDARGGAALSIYYVIKKPIKFISTGEKIEDFEQFYPDRISSRILGMGDVLTLIENAEKVIDEKKAKEMEEKIFKNELNFEDFVYQLKGIKKMGSLEKIFSMIPIKNKSKILKNVNLNDSQLDRVEAIINSMTVDERRKPFIINGSRKKRIASGSGTTVSDVNRLLKQFNKTKQMLKQFSSLDRSSKLPFGNF
ncbi:MAG: signal recognition particle protein [Actinobacteria bacterium]|nr:signal recognition particle protein [Actinomycetota bacterium]